MKKTIIGLVLLLIGFAFTFCKKDDNSIETDTGSEQAITDGLVAYWPFNGNANDESENSHNGTVAGATLTADRAGNANSAYYFDGNDYITVDGTNLLNINSGEYTVSLWAKPSEGQSATWARMLSFGNAGYGGYSLICIEPWNGLFTTNIYTDNGSVTNSVSFNSDVTNLSVWSMLSFTYKNGVMKGYLNGILIDQIASGAYTESGFDLIIGASSSLGDNFIGSIDEVCIYNRALTAMEIAQLSGMPGAVRATRLGAHSYADFELKALEPLKCGDAWNIWGAGSLDPISYITTVENPVKDGSNTSDYVGVAVTPRSNVAWDGTCRKKEYVIRTSADSNKLYDQHHIMQWKFLIADSTLLKIDTIVNYWMSFNQIHGGFQLYDGGTCENGGSIAYGGGIFNDNVKAHSYDDAKYSYRYRAMPDSAQVEYKVDVGKWMTFTYEIFWTNSSNGYWKLWKDGELLGSADNVKTIADCAPNDGNFLQWKTGLYNKWWDPVIDTIRVYFDDLELYIGDDIKAEEICPECFGL